jgi:prepilin-type N-terminal cleavage/methylation domain-containing protein
LSQVVTRRRPRLGGFTLIEVMAALLVFSAGLIMLLSITRSLSRRLEWAALESLITAEGQERLDSLDAVAYPSLAVGSDVDTLTLRGVPYRRTQTITQFTSLVRRAVVTIEPLGSAAGPTFEATTFSSGAW